MLTVLLSVLCAVMVVAAFAAGLLIGVKFHNKTNKAAPAYSASCLTPEEEEEIELKRKRKKAEDEAFAVMQGYNQNMVYQMVDSSHSEGM